MAWADVRGRTFFSVISDSKPKNGVRIVFSSAYNFILSVIMLQVWDVPIFGRGAFHYMSNVTAIHIIIVTLRLPYGIPGSMYNVKVC